jgi:hypothetical protein
MATDSPTPLPSNVAAPVAQRPLLAIAVVAGLGLLLGCLACGGVAALYGTGGGGQHPAVPPPFVKKNAKVKLFTPVSNFNLGEEGIVKEVSGSWVQLELTGSKARPYWINFANVTHCRLEE